MEEKQGEHQHLKIKISISGAAETDHCGDSALSAAHILGSEIVKQGGIVVTGATTGFPLWAAKGAKEAGGMVIGISPAATEEEHVSLYKLPLEYHDLIIYTGSGYSGRNLLLTRSADAVIVGCGRIGTINEFTVAFEDEKPLGVLEGSWMTDEVIKKMVAEGHRENDRLIFDQDPKNLVTRVIHLVEEKRKDGYGVYTAGGPLYKNCTDKTCRIIL
jgi:hypothetical protein